MPQSFESATWMQAVADLVGASDAGAVAAGLTTVVEAVVEHEGTALLAFHKNARPDVLHHTLGPAARKHVVEPYDFLTRCLPEHITRMNSLVSDPAKHIKLPT